MCLSMINNVILNMVIKFYVIVSNYHNLSFSLFQTCYGRVQRLEMVLICIE